VDSVMSSHIVNKKLDPRGLPGTLSSRMIDSVLRKQLKYNGVVFSDDMQMQAITNEYGLETAVKLAINAGVDVLCFSNNIQGSEVRTVDKVHGIIRSLVQSGQIRPERIDEAFLRITKFKSMIGFKAEDYLRRELEVTRQELYELKKDGAKPEVKQEINNAGPVQPAIEEKKVEDKKKKDKKKND